MTIHYKCFNNTHAHNASLIKVNDLNWEREAEKGEGRHGGERGREVERPWRTAAEREVGPGTIERNEASPETPNKPRGRQKERNPAKEGMEGERERERETENM